MSSHQLTSAVCVLPSVRFLFLPSLPSHFLYFLKSPFKDSAHVLSAECLQRFPILTEMLLFQYFQKAQHAGKKITYTYKTIFRTDSFSSSSCYYFPFSRLTAAVY